MIIAGNDVNKILNIEHFTSLKRLNQEFDSFPSVIDKSIIGELGKIQSGEGQVSLNGYTSLDSYQTIMNSLYGDSSAEKFNSTLNKLIDKTDDTKTTVKEFINKLGEMGVEKNSARKLYTALKAYTAPGVEVTNNNSFVSAKI